MLFIRLEKLGPAIVRELCSRNEKRGFGTMHRLNISPVFEIGRNAHREKVFRFVALASEITGEAAFPKAPPRFRSARLIDSLRLINLLDETDYAFQLVLNKSAISLSIEWHIDKDIRTWSFIVSGILNFRNSQIYIKDYESFKAVRFSVVCTCWTKNAFFGQKNGEEGSLFNRGRLDLRCFRNSIK